MAPELRVVVVSRVELYAVCAEPALIAREIRVNRTFVDGVTGGAGHVLPVVFRAQREASSAGLQIVLPRDLILVGAKLGPGGSAQATQIVERSANSYLAFPIGQKTILAVEAISGKRLIVARVVSA